MSDRGFLGVIIFCALGLSSCSSKKDDAQKTLVEMSKHKVVLPLGEMGCFHSAVDTVERKDIAPMKYNFVHYVDSSQSRIQQASAKLRNVFVKALLWC